MGKVLVKMYLDEEILTAVDRLAEQEVRSRSGMLGILVRLGLLEQGSGPADDVIADLEAVAGPEVISSGPFAGQTRPRKRGGNQSSDRTAGELSPPPKGPAPGAPAAPVDTPAAGPHAGSTNAPGKPHRHRFQIEVEGTRQGRAGIIQADYACECGQIKRLAVR